jgi:hypothetical protein
MDKLLKKTIIFLGVCIIITLISVLALNQFNNIYHNKLRPYRKEIKQTKVLITGTSHCLWGINPKKLGVSAINIGEVNKPIEIDLEILKNNLDINKDLRLVIIPIDYFTLFFNGLKKGENFEKRYYYHWGIKAHQDVVDNYFGHFLTCGSDVIKNLLTGKYKTASGFTAKNQDFSKISKAKQREFTAKRIAGWNKQFIDSSQHTFITNNLIKTILLLKNHGINCFLITCPVSTEMKKNYNPELVKIINSEIKKIVSATNVRYEDFNSLPNFKEDYLFRDCDHLNLKGSKELTAVIKSRIQDLYHLQ